ncbi:MAG: hypothetical protein HY873_07755 [Chloroflexi bacterium]|nr:hypothetical protein [Chloroflexota bacterium]
MTASNGTPPARRPMYSVPMWRLPGLAVSLVLGRSRSFVRDSRIVLEANRACPRRIEGIEHIPESGNFVLVMNHYSRRGLRPFHCAMVASTAIAERRPGLPEIRWTFTSEYLGLRAGPIPIPMRLIRWLFRRVSLVYGFVVMPRREELRLGRASALRELLRALDAGPIAITPEGLESSGRLIEPQEGVGRFLGMASRREPLLPAGLWEDDAGTLHARFGPAFRVTRATHELPAGEEDRRLARQVMVEIGLLLPREFWGAYEADLTADRSAPDA